MPIGRSVPVSGSGSGGAGGINTINGTSEQITASTSGATTTLSIPNPFKTTGQIHGGFIETNGSLTVRAYGESTAAEKDRNFMQFRHKKVSTTASGWQDLFSVRPKIVGTGADPTDNSFYGTISGYIIVNLHASGVGNGHRKMDFALFFNGSSASSADGYNNDTSGTVVDFRINRVGWVSTFQIQRTGSMTGLVGSSTIALCVGRGAGSNGENIYWDVT